MGSFRNRIINGDMRIAQRGTSNVLVTSVAGFPLDRIFVYGVFTAGGVTAYQNTLSVSDAPYQQGLTYASNLVCTSGLTSTQMFIGQSIEASLVSDLIWGTSFGSPITVSFWFKSSASGITSFTIRNKPYFNYSYLSPPLNYPTAGVWQYFTVTVPPPPNGSTWNMSGNASGLELDFGYYLPGLTATGWTTVNLAGYSNQIMLTGAGSYIAYTGVQLEKGTVATPFEFRPYATELQLCQRYFTQLGGQMAFNYFGSGLASSATSAYILCPLPVPMRYPTGSTVTTVGNFNLIGLISGTFGGVAAGAIAKDQQNINNIELAVACANMTAGSPYMLYVQNSLASLIQINNEL